MLDVLHAQGDAVFRCHLIAGNRHTVKNFNNNTADGIIIFTFQIRIQSIVDIIQFHAALHQILPFSDFLNEFILVGIVFIPDFTHDFLQKILEGDHAGTGAVFIQHKGYIKTLFPHFYHQVGCFFVLISIIGIPEDIGNTEIFPILYQDKILDIHKADNIIVIILIHRNTGIHIFLKYAEKLFITGFHAYSAHIDTGNHDILGNRIAEIKHIVNHFPFFRFNDAVFMTDIHVSL